MRLSESSLVTIPIELKPNVQETDIRLSFRERLKSFLFSLLGCVNLIFFSYI